MSLPIANGMPVYPRDPKVIVKVVHTYECHTWELRSLSMGSHTGTHMDAPSHMHPGAPTLDELPLERFFGASRVVRIEDPDWPECRGGLFFAEAAGLEYYD
jgi:kynurenine formamidase